MHSDWYELLPAEATKLADERAMEIRLQAKLNFDKTAAELAPMSPGAKVAMQDASTKKWDHRGTVTEVAGRSYTVEDESGRTTRRNRKHLRGSPPSMETPMCSEEPEPPRRGGRARRAPRRWIEECG